MDAAQESLLTIPSASSCEEMPPPPAPLSDIQSPPSDVYQQPLRTMDEYYEQSKPPKYVIGDLIWAKMTGHPYWPCMVTEDPLLKTYTKFTGKGMRTYHCQFFGSEAERGWITESTTLKFEGREPFLQFVESSINSAGTKAQRKQLCQKYEVRSTRKSVWDLACSVAEQALQLDIEERKDVYTFRYRDLPENSPGAQVLSPVKKTANKRHASGSGSDSGGKKSKFTTIKSPLSSKSPSATSNTSLEQLSSSPERVKQSSDPYAFEDADASRSRLSHSPEDANHLAHSSPIKPPPVRDPVPQKSVTENRKPLPPSAKQIRSLQGNVMAGAEPQGRKAKSKSSPNVGNIPRQLVYEIQRLSSTCSIKKENICLNCEQSGGDLVACTGGCLRWFHQNCGGFNGSESLKCHECTTEAYKCLICRMTGPSVQKCSDRHCERFYHPACVSSHPLTRKEGNRFTCPLHVCSSCARGDPRNEKAAVGKLYRCVQCPTAYHTGDFCIAAGSQLLGGHHIVCNNHSLKSSNPKNQQHINVSWCFTCSTGGTLICCESCPAAFHQECLKIEVPEGTWHCPDCVVGIRPRYGDIVWVKLGSYRWWPAEVCHPEHVPLNIQHKPHQANEFPVHFLGSNDYYWTHQGRVFMYQDGDKGSKESATGKNLDKMFKQALKEAAEAYRLVTEIRENKDQDIAKKCESRPKKFRYIKTNLPIPPVTLAKIDKEQIPVCECRPNRENPCGDDKVCLNRILMYECHPATCPAGDTCQNQRFQKRQYPKQEPFRTGDERGWGLRCKEDIKRGQFVNEYVGELIDENECKRRIEKAHAENVTSFYMLTLDKNRIIDAGPKGNLARFGNHSCSPNMKTQKWFVNGNWRVGLFAMEDIAAGSELTFNYNLVSVGDQKLKCICKSPACSGFIGDRPKIQLNGADKLKPKKKKRTPKPKHDDFCFRCLDGGELVMCNKPKCVKAYHLQCLGLDKVPYGKWDCPWHHCDVCGKSAVILCYNCPNSFCADHSGRNIALHQEVPFCRHHSSAEITEALACYADKKGNSAPSTPPSVCSSIDG